MNLETLEEQTMTLIKSPEIRDPHVLAMLSSIPAKIEQLKARRAEIDREAAEIETKLATFSTKAGKLSASAELQSTSYTRPHLEATRSARSKVRVRINWTDLGKNLPPEEISLSKGSDTLSATLDRLAAVLGIDVLEKLRSFAVSRGPLVSQSPSTDFVNRANGRLYQHQRIGLTQYYVLTHSSTPEKVDYLRQVHRFLGAPKEAIEVSEVTK